MNSVLSVDLAARRYKDLGIAVLHGSSSPPQVEFVHPADLGLKGQPNAAQLADALIRIAGQHGVRLILLDGPQGWKAPDSLDPHMRSCERLTRTPGRTGRPGVVKPAPWTRMATFSIDIFDRLDALGWPRFDANWNGQVRSVETFPTHAWRSLGLSPLPAKNKRPDLARWYDQLREATGLRGNRMPGHDELQTAVAGLAGLQLLDSSRDPCTVLGDPPFLADGHWREGFIVSPAGR